MSIVGIFTRAQPSVGGYLFDAIISESTELSTESTKFPIENGSIGSDHISVNPLSLTLTVGVSDNPFRTVLSQAGQFSALAGAGAGALTGALVGQLGDVAALAGLGASIINADFAAGQFFTRSQGVLDALRELQLRGQIIDVVTTKKTYEGCIISSTRQETNKENEQGLELIIELEQILIINSFIDKEEILAPNDTAETQGQSQINIGEVSLQQ